MRLEKNFASRTEQQRVLFNLTPLFIMHRESKKGATLMMAITLSILDRFAKFFH